MSDQQQGNGEGTAVTVSERTKQLVSTLEGAKDSIMRALAGNADPDRFIQIVATAFMNSNRLQKCSFVSIYRAAIECAQVGLKPDGEEAAIVPYYNTDAGETEAQFQPMYQGLVRLMLRSGARKVEAHPVYANDEFDYHYGLKPDLVHKPGPSDRRGEITHAYAIVWLPSGEVQFEVMDRAELDKIKEFGMQARKGVLTPAWRQWESEMHRKAPLRRLRKWVELDPYAAAAFRKDETLEGGESVPLGDLDPRFETRALSERAAGHARRQTRELAAAIHDRTGPAEEIPAGDAPAGDAPAGDGAGEEDREEAAARERKKADDVYKLDLDTTVASGKYKGRTWRYVLKNDRRYAEEVVAHGWILDDAGIAGLRAHLRETARTDPGKEDEEEGPRPEEADPVTADLERELKELHERGLEVATLLAEHGDLDPDEAEELDLLHADGNLGSLRRLVQDLEERAEGREEVPGEEKEGEDGEPGLFDGDDGERS